MGKKTSLLLAFLGGIGALVILGSSPETLGDRVGDYIAAQAPYSGRYTVLPAAAQTTPLGINGGAPDLFGWGDLLVVRSLSSDAATCAFVSSSSVSLGAHGASGGYGVAGGCTLTTTIGTSLVGASCFPMQGGGSGRHDMVAKRVAADRSLRLRSRGLCSAGVTSAHGRLVFPACRSNNDCTEMGAGSTCETGVNFGTDERWTKSGAAMIVCRPGNANVTLHRGVEG